MLARKMEKGLITLYKTRKLEKAAIKKEEAYRKAMAKLNVDSSKLIYDCDHFIVLNLGRESLTSKHDRLKCVFCGASYEEGNNQTDLKFHDFAKVDVSENKYQGICTQEYGSVAYAAILNYIQDFAEALTVSELRENIENNCDEIIRMFVEQPKDKKMELYLQNKKPSFFEE